MERVRAVIAEIEPNDSPERFRGLGVDVVFGEGRFVSPSAFEVNGRRLTARTFVIATGSRPAVPPIAGLESVPYLTNETVFDLREPVPSLAVIGGGPIGVELAQAFRRLGSEVAVVEMGSRLLPKEDRDAADVVHHALVHEGVAFHLEATVARVAGRQGAIALTLRDAAGVERQVDATHLLVAAGRRLNTDGLGLDAAGVRMAQNRIVVDGTLRTSQPHIYAIGDAAGGYQFTHLAEHHAGIVLRHAIFRLFWAKPSSVLPWCTYTDPELARVGLSEAEAQERRVPHRVYRFAFEEIDRAHTDGETEGFAKLLTDPKGRLLGAAIVGPHAGELIAEYALAIAKRMSASDISSSIHAYPTLASISRRVADQRMKEGLTPNARRWIQRVFRLQGA
jgi:pyruvate/2-oxoglutarate dehydrogenase complex dihydrolipoamide dehydrogenase (E3) component